MSRDKIMPLQRSDGRRSCHSSLALPQSQPQLRNLKWCGRLMSRPSHRQECSFAFHLLTMVQCGAKDCTQDGQSQCGRCKRRFYCSVECQHKDWPAHKNDCRRPGAPAMEISPLGQMFNIFSGQSTPLSSKARFFAPVFGYTSAHPERVYADVVNAYRLLRLGAHLNAGRMPLALRDMAFGEWMERVAGAGILPEWWDADVHRAGIEAYVHEDAWGRLDRIVSRDEIRATVDPPARIMSLEMMIERVMNSSTEEHEGRPE
ncbi:hypothetical protein B0H15DRAFT_856509 [Mycena belliarum]|uniref:MYND-type domain-containing protein n=1 Tax=Mycena belliarum TaxID=1033014 RepID=A0AAD6TX43_9AGAR|nr:hypothetical protein B0H15DRAFT_856509 [Mycena belliae]